MKHEFKVTKSKDQTVYTLESATGGSSSTAGGATVSTALGGVRRRGDNLLAQEADKNKVPATTPRNFVAKNAKTSGAGAHADKKKAAKQGDVKHKKPFAEEGVAEDKEDKIAQLKKDHATAVHWSKNEKSPQKREAARQKAEKIKGHLEKQYKQGVAEADMNRRGFLKGLGAAALGGAGVGAAQAGIGADLAGAAAKGLYYGTTSRVAGSAIHKKQNEEDLAFAEKIPDAWDKTRYLKAVKYIIRSRDDSVMRYAGHSGSASRGSIIVAERNFKKLKTELSQKYNIPLDPVKEQGVAEGFNGEYDDEAGMAQSNLLTTARAVMGLLKTIKDRDNLPEWGQEKIAKAEMMLVSVWDYLQSQKQMGNDPQVDEVAESVGDIVSDSIEALRSSVPGLKQQDFLDELYMYIENQYGQRAAEMMSNADQADYDEWYDSYLDNPEQGMAETEKKGLYYYVNKRKKAGTSRDADSPKAPTAQAWKDAAKTAKKESADPYFESLVNKLDELKKKK